VTPGALLGIGAPPDPGDRFAPDFRIDVDGAPVPAELRASISGVTWTSGIEGAARVEMSIVNENLRWLDHPLLAVDRALELSIGYAPGRLARVFKGQIVTQEATFPASGGPSLTVAAQDRLERLAHGEKVRWFAIPVPTVTNAPLPDVAVAGIVSLENGLLPMFDPVGAAISVILAGAEAAAAIDDPGVVQRLIRKQEGQSDLDFLKRIAKENGWEMSVDHTGPAGGHTLRFWSPLDDLSPDVTLAYGRSLVAFTPRLSVVGQIVSVTAYVWVAAIKTDFAITVGWDWDRAALTIDVRPALVPLGQAPSQFLIAEPVTPASAPRKILGELIPKLNRRLTGTATTVGDPRIVGGSVVRLEGVGERFGGLYRVTEATHRIDASGYSTGFSVRKEIWFGSIPLPEQGALPVRIQGQRLDSAARGA
jgi:phage protein D